MGDRQVSIDPEIIGKLIRLTMRERSCTVLEAADHVFISIDRAQYQPPGLRAPGLASGSPAQTPPENGSQRRDVYPNEYME